MRPILLALAVSIGLALSAPAAGSRIGAPTGCSVCASHSRA